jgi:pyruvate, orthophosphate dikinase
VTDDDTLIELVVRGGSQNEVDPALERLSRAGLAMVVGAVTMPTHAGADRAGRLLAASPVQPKLMAWYDRFLVINHELRTVCTQWQCLPDGRPNNHSDATYDAHVRDQLLDIHDRITPVLAGLAEGLPRLTRYPAQLRTAMDRLASGDAAWFTSPACASYHTVWMRVHQELLLALGISRTADAEREQDLVRETGELFTTGLGVSAGVGSGRIVLSVEEAVDLASHAVPVVLVMPETSPADLPGIRVAAAILTVRGGTTSHAAVVARGLGIPVVCGAGQLRVDAITVSAGGRTLAAGDLISVDGTSGAVYVGARPTTTPVAVRPPDVGTPRRLRVLANADTADDVRTALALGADGIGLCRSEHQFSGHGLTLLRRFVTTEDPEAAAELAESQRAAFRELFGMAGARQVTVRLLDAPAHEFLATPGEPSEWDEANPMLGVRGVRLAVVRPELYRIQARAILLAWLDVAPAPDLGIMIPMVSLPAEMVWAAGLIREVARDVAGVPYRLGCMVETPRAALVADQLAATADFLCFGTNDLTQLTYGFSRDDIERAVLLPYRRVGLLTDSPFARLDTDGVAALLTIAAEKARTVRPDIELGLCGEHGSDPRSLDCCERLGLNYVSCSPHQIPAVLHATEMAETAEPGGSR